MAEEEENGIPQIIDVGQLAQALQRQKQQMSYVEAMKLLAEKIKSRNPQDRLGFILSMIEVISAVSLSTKGWNEWLNAWRASPESAETISLEDLQRMYPKLRKLALEFIFFDLEVTEWKDKEFKVKVEEKRKEEEAKKPKPKPEKKKDAYVA